MNITFKKLLSNHDWRGVVETIGSMPPGKITDNLLFLLTQSLLKLGNLDEAIEVAKPYLEKNISNYPRATRISARVLCLKGEYDSAYSLLKKAFDSNPTQYWYYLAMGDVYYYFAGNKEKALSIYKEGEGIGKEHLRKDILSIYRYLLKRISHVLFEIERFEEAVPYFRKFKKLEPSNFYESDFVLLGLTLEKTGDIEGAKDIWLEGTRRRKGTKCLKELKRVDPELASGVKLKPSHKPKPGAKTIAVKTKIITEEDEAPDLINECIKDIAKPGDVITFASAVAAVSEGRIYSAEGIKASKLATFLSGFVSGSSKNSFATTSPLANPLSFQVAIEIAGVFRILLATFIGAVGKLFKIKGWFYHIAGKEVAMIDDMPASMAPYDFYVIPGPYNSDLLSEMIKEKTGYETAIVDANDLGIAWVVGASSGVDKKKVEQYMLDNPAGNEDNQTPIILVREEGKSNV